MAEVKDDGWVVQTVGELVALTVERMVFPWVDGMVGEKVGKLADGRVESLAAAMEKCSVEC